jgi:hypothetical protein
MAQYRYTLQRYGGIKTRFTCPECGKPHQFTRYVDTTTGEYIADHVGRCNRESNCGYHYRPSEFFKNEKMSASQFNNKAEVPITTFDTIPGDLVSKSLAFDPKSNFHSFLIGKYNNAAEEALQRFRVGTSATRTGGTIFWQIDITGTIRSGKIIQYDSSTGKRGKYIDWVHSLISKRKNITYRLKQCFFGEDQLAKDLSSPVGIVESEKTAIICSIHMPEYTWLATGGVNGCKWTDSRVASVLLGRKVVLFPDLGMHSKWSQKCRALQREIRVDIKVSDIVERATVDIEKLNNSGFDLADYLLKQ